MNMLAEIIRTILTEEFGEELKDMALDELKETGDLTIIEKEDPKALNYIISEYVDHNISELLIEVLGYMVTNLSKDLSENDLESLTIAAINDLQLRMSDDLPIINDDLIFPFLDNPQEADDLYTNNVISFEDMKKKFDH